MKNYWPFGIFLLAMVVVGLIVLTIKVAARMSAVLPN